MFTSPLDSVAYSLERFFIENKFMGLFSFLFGVSFWLFLSRAEGRGAGGTGLFYRRIFWLFVIASVHGWVLWFWDILRFYALWAVLLPLFVRTPPKRLLAVALSCCVLIPAVIAGAGYAAQIVIARAWLNRVRFGPAEWLWRSLTYWERQPFKLSSPAPVRVQA